MMPDDVDAVSDTELVERSRKGDQQAYGLVVQRYQSLVCSVAYNRCGDLALSEDFAQDAFIQAWKNIAGLRDAEAFKSWICTIVRNLTTKASKKKHFFTQNTLEFASEIQEQNESPADQAVTAEEEKLVWQALQEIPETYREPMILFYREEQSIKSVAMGLELTENTVKQRLSRGRKMLQQRLATTVETTLSRSRPSKRFTASVLAGIAGLIPNSATASGVSPTTAVVTTGVANTGVAKMMKAGVFASAGASMGAMFLSLLAQLPVLRWMHRKSEKSLELLSDEELLLLNQMSFRRPWVQALRLAIFFGSGAIALRLSSNWENELAGFAIFFGLVIAGNLPMFLWDWKLNRQMRQLRIDTGIHNPPAPLVDSADSRVVVWKTLLYIAMGGHLITAWPVLLATFHSDWLVVPILFAASTALSLIAWMLSLRFPARSAQCCAMSFPVIGLLGIATFMMRRSRWSHGITDFGWFFASMVGMAMTIGVLCMLVGQRMYRPRS